MTSKKHFLNQIVAQAHAVIVEIPRGYGFDFAKKQIDFPADSNILDFYPTIHDKQKTEIINTDDIETLRTKLRGKSQKRQFVILHEAEKMNEAAQNKFLKLLEEPRDNLNFILLTTLSDNLLPTVKSRAQIVKIAPISRENSEEILNKLKIDDTKRRQIMFLAEGLPEEIERLATDKKYFTATLKNIETAKQWLSGNDFDRLVMASKIKSDREAALNLLESLIKISRATINESTAARTARQLRKILRAYNRISKNGSVRAELLRLILP